MLMLQPVAIAGVMVLLAVGGEQKLLLTLGGHQVWFFIIPVACHGGLARTPPAARHPTGIFVSLSFFGMVGGLFAGLIAPYTFSWIAEYPILLALAALCRPSDIASRRGSFILWLVAINATLILVWFAYQQGTATEYLENNRVWVVAAVAVM